MDMIAQIEAEQIASLSKEIPDFKAGDTIKVGYKVTEGTRSRIQNYEYLELIVFQPLLAYFGCFPTRQR